MRQMRNAVLALLVMAVSGSTVVAQDKGKLEVGADVAAITSRKYDGSSGSSTTIGLNGGTVVRVAKNVTDKVAVEPNISFTHGSSTGSSYTYTNIGVGVLYYLMKRNGSKPGWYVRPWAGMEMDKSSSGSFSSSTTRMNFGAGAGMSRAAMGAIWRAEAFLSMWPEKGSSPAYNDMGIKLGGGFTP